MSAHKHLKTLVLQKLNEQKSEGLLQADMEGMLKFSRSYVSETLKELKNENIIVMRNVSKKIKRAWLTEYYPGIPDGLVRVGVLRSSEYVKSILALYKIFELENRKLIVHAYESVAELLKDLSSSILEIAMAPFYSSVLYSLIEGNPIISPIAYGGSAIVSKGNNQTCYISEISTMAKLAQVYFHDKPNVELKSYGNMKMNISEFLSNGGYMTLWEPYLSLLTSDPEIKVACNYEDILKNIPCCLISLNKEFFRKNVDIAKRISLIDYDKISTDSNQKLNNKMEEIALILGFDKEILKVTSDRYKFYKNYKSFIKDVKELDLILTERQLRIIFPFLND
ncbi:MAG: hypothetical protein ACYDAO_07620 [Thermoplasmataceae archaeon]